MIASLLQKVRGFSPGHVLHLLIPRVLMTTAMLGGAGTMLSAGSAHAGLFGWGEIFPTIGTGACNSPNSDARCTFQDKVVSNFVTNYTLSSASPDTRLTTINFTEVFGIIDLNVTFNPDLSFGGPFTMSYDIEITDPAKSFKEIGLDSICVLANVGPCSVQKEIAYYVNNVLQPINPALTQISNNGGPAGPSPIGAAVRKIRITDTWATTPSGSLRSFSNNFTQTTNTVPGPLPLMGVGAAFAFSRRLRRRLNVTAKARA